MKGIKHFLPLSEYIKLTFNPSEMSHYFKMACMWPKMIIFQGQKLIEIGNTTQIKKNVVSLS